MIVKYKERHFIDKYRCIDTYREVEITKPWRVGSILYGYTDRYNVISISIYDIIWTKD